MKSEKNGIGTLETLPEIQVQGVSPLGFWILIKEKEYFLDFETYPWFKDAKVGQIFNVQLLHENHLFWNELDIDLEVDSLDAPEKYPLISRAS